MFTKIELSSLVLGSTVTTCSWSESWRLILYMK